MKLAIMSIDWGSVPDWFAGLGALTALYFARSAVLAASDTNEKQAQQINQLEEDRKLREEEQAAREERQRRTQAESVAFWVSSDFNDHDAALVRYVNSSLLPMYSVLICCHTPTGLVEERYPVLGPLSEKRTLRRATKALRERLHGMTFAHLHSQGRVLVAASFRDAAGVWWYRTPEGELHDAENQEDAKAGARKPADARSMQH